MRTIGATICTPRQPPPRVTLTHTLPLSTAARPLLGRARETPSARAMAKSHRTEPQHQGMGGVSRRNLPRRSLDEAVRPEGGSELLRRGNVAARRAWSIPRVKPCVIAVITVACCLLFLAAWLHNSMEDGGMRTWLPARRHEEERGGKAGRVLRFTPGNLLRRFDEQGGLDRIRSEPRIGIRPPRLGIVLGDMQKDSSSLLVFTVVKSLKELGYNLTVFAVKSGKARPYWEVLGGRIYMLGPDNAVDWSIFEGIIFSSLEAESAITSLMQEPFLTVPLIWIVQEDTLGERLSLYREMDWQHLIAMWRRAFSRADIVVFPDFSLPLLYTTLDIGNFFVIPGSPVDVWAAESYARAHSRSQLRRDNGFREDDSVVIVIGSCFTYDGPWWYTAALHLIISQLEFSKKRELEGSFKFVFLSGNSTDGQGNALQDIISHLGFSDGSVRQYGLDGDVNEVLLMADIVFYGSLHEEQSFPPLLVRAMSFGISIIAPDLAIVKKYVTNGVDGFIFQAHDPQSLKTAFSLAMAESNLYDLGHTTATFAKLLSKNMLAWDCITGYAKLLENVIQFPSDTSLPSSTSQIQQHTWEWNFLLKETENARNETQYQEDIESMSSIVYALEEELDDEKTVENASMNHNVPFILDNPSELDWEDIREMEFSEDSDRREIQELMERTERTLGSWEDTYRKSRKALKMKPEDNEQDEGELQQIGQHICIYEIYNGAGTWPFLHHDALYRGLSLSKEAQEHRVDDVVAIHRLPLLNNTYYKDLLCEYGGMLAIANRVDSIQKTPWIGFQSWRAAGRKVSLSVKAEKALDKTLRAETRGDVFYYWVRADLDGKDTWENKSLDFWSLCDILNNGLCRDMFENAFRLTYALPSDIPALPPMPASGHWSALHSWVMPTPSFLEFVMFSRMFVDSLDSLNDNSHIPNSCLLGSTNSERRHCYCRVLELLVNVWAYHSARKMVYLNPESGELKEQHPVVQRVGLMQVKFFNFSLLKGMDEDLAESMEDKFPPRKRWLWPLTGEVYCPLIMEKEREERYRHRNEKHRKDKEKQLEKKRAGRSQKPLG